MQAFTGELTQNPHLYGVRKEGTKPKEKLNCSHTGLLPSRRKSGARVALGRESSLYVPTFTGHFPWKGEVTPMTVAHSQRGW